MKFTREQPEGLYTIHAYEEGCVTVNSPDAGDARDEEGRIAVQSSFVIAPRRLLQEWEPGSLAALEAQHLTAISALEPEVVLLGTGRQLQFPQNALLGALIEMGAGYEVMDSQAACRTYNILAGEGRQVAAAIIIEN